MGGTENPLRIIRVDLPDESMKSSRLLARQDGNEYPVIVYFSRKPNPFERVALEDELGIRFSDINPMSALYESTTLEMFVNEIEGINSSIDNAVANARAEREAAQKEDARLRELANKLSRELRSAAE